MVYKNTIEKQVLRTITETVKETKVVKPSEIYALGLQFILAALHGDRFSIVDFRIPRLGEIYISSVPTMGCGTPAEGLYTANSGDVTCFTRDDSPRFIVVEVAHHIRIWE